MRKSFFFKENPCVCAVVRCIQQSLPLSLPDSALCDVDSRRLCRKRPDVPQSAGRHSTARRFACSPQIVLVAPPNSVKFLSTSDPRPAVAPAADVASNFVHCCGSEPKKKRTCDFSASLFVSSEEFIVPVRGPHDPVGRHNRTLEACHPGSCRHRTARNVHRHRSCWRTAPPGRCVNSPLVNKPSDHYVSCGVGQAPHWRRGKPEGTSQARLSPKPITDVHRPEPKQLSCGSQKVFSRVFQK